MSQEKINNQEEFTKAEIAEARKKLWKQGILEWKLDSTQKEIYEFIKNSKKKTVTINAARRLGKTYMLTVYAAEICLQKPKQIVKFIQPEQKMIRMNIKPIMDKLFDDAPKNLRPQFKTMDNVYIFPNGSEIQLSGTDNGNEEKMRGGDAHICIIDEAAFVKSKLEYIVQSILMPTTTITGGKIILSSTSPKEPDHPFKQYMEKGIVQGTFLKKTIYDAVNDPSNKRITKEIVQEIINEYGNANDDSFRREYLCEIVSDGDNSVVPEFTEEVQEDIITEWNRPIFCDRYVSMDIGFKDLTVVLFAYYDYDNGVIVVEDELIMSGKEMTTANLAMNIHSKEKKLWTDLFTQEFIKPYLRVSDNNLIVINDLAREYELYFKATEKTNKEAEIANMRDLIASRQIIIYPRCKTLISHLRNATWSGTSGKRTFARSPDHGHYDAVDALLYLSRNVQFSKNPYPPGYRRGFIGVNSDDIFYAPHYENSQKPDYQTKLEEIFKPKSSFGAFKKKSK